MSYRINSSLQAIVPNLVLHVFAPRHNPSACPRVRIVWLANVPRWPILLEDVGLSACGQETPEIVAAQSVNSQFLQPKEALND
jgi:hypothetical protein